VRRPRSRSDAASAGSHSTSRRRRRISWPSRRRGSPRPARTAPRVVPRRAHERDAARERLEHADGGDAGQRPHVRPPRHVHRGAEAGEGLGRPVVGQPPRVLDAGVGQLGARVVGVAHAVHAGAQAEVARRGEQELAQLLGALLVAPVAHPHQVALALRVRQRAEDALVGGLVPRPRARGPPLAQVHLPHRLAEREHAVVRRQVVGAHRRRVGDRPVVRVVEDEPEAPARGAPPPRRRDERVLVPLVHEHERPGVGAVERPVERALEVGRVVDVPHAGERRVGVEPAVEGGGPGLAARFSALHAPAGSHACTWCPRAPSSRATPRRKCALPWFQSLASECVNRTTLTRPPPRPCAPPRPRRSRGSPGPCARACR
jgi:hypothetical protein